jgi:moderate conductance mechanosensitive channel
MDDQRPAGFCLSRRGMSARQSMGRQHRWAMRLGRLASWLLWLCLALAPILSASTPAVAADVASAVDAEVQPNLHSQVIGVLNVIHGAVDRSLTAVAASPAEARRLRAAATAAWQSGDILRATIYCFVLLLIGGGAEWLYWCYAGRGWRAIAEAAVGREILPPARAATLGLRRAALGAFGTTMFACGVLVPASLLSWRSEVQAGVVGVVLAITAVRIAGIASVLILSPRSARLRLVSRSDRSASRLTVALVALSAVLTAGSGVQSLLRDVLNAPGLATIVSAVSGIVVAGLAMLILRQRGSAPRAERSLGPVVYPIALTTTVLLCLALHLLGAHEIVSTALLWIAAIMIGNIVWPVVDAYTKATNGAQNRAVEYRSVMRSGVRIIIFSAAAVATTAVWNIPLLQLVQSPTFTGQVLVRSFNMIVVLLVGDLIWVWARTIIDGKLAAIPPRAKADGPDPTARRATLLPLLRKVILGILLTLAGLTALSVLGIDIAPLLAGAGVVGIAIGLGAQTLVRDILSGVLYLLADSFRVGEYVEFGEIRGTVEGISLRFLRIRHHRGAVHTVPFGELKWLTNLSRDWAIMKLEFRLPFDANLMLVRKIVEEVSAELIADTKFGLHMIEPLECRGIVRMEEFNMVLGVRCMTKPNGGRFDIRREAYHRIRDAFDAHDIHFVHRKLRVDAPGEARMAVEGTGTISLHELSEVVHQASSDSPLTQDDDHGKKDIMQASDTIHRR